MPGVFIQKGMAINIAPGGLSFTVGPDGKLSGTMKMHVYYEICAKWLEISFKHLVKSKEANSEKILNWGTMDDEKKVLVIESELEYSIQSMMASAIALDGFYACLIDKNPVPLTLRATWNKKTSRPAIITEMIKRSFTMKNADVQKLKNNISILFKFRDWAVHPAGQLDEPVYLQEIDVSVERRFAMFRFGNALVAHKEAMAIVHGFVNSNKGRNERIKKWSKALSVLIEPHYKKSVDTFGTNVNIYGS